MDQRLRTVFRGLLAQGTPNLTQFIKDAIPHLSQKERNTLQRELDRANAENRSVRVMITDDLGRYNFQRKTLRECTDAELRQMLARGLSGRTRKAIKFVLKQREGKLEAREPAAASEL